ncbi:MMPL family transporter [Ferrimicrobium acidiphilum]|uniref:MMPL family transporter n=1 Tax=Ferrimicrobium acidiphilum TaxID=121039 RepID=A0ABV3Y1X1_9ACTN
MSRFFEQLGLFTVRFRYAIVVVWIAGLLAALAFLPSLGSVVQSNFSNFLPTNSPSIKAAQLADVFQKSTDSTVVVVADDPHHVLTSADTSYLTHLARELKTVPSVVRSNVAAISQNGRAEQIEVVSSTSQFNDIGIKSLVNDMAAKLKASPAPADLQVHLAGTVATAVAQADQNNSSASATQGFSVLFILVLLLIVFRSILAPFLTLLPAFIVSLLAGPVVARLTSVLHYQVSSVTQLLMIVLVLGAGTDYGLFLVFRTREELNRGRGTREAVEHALSKVGESITFSALTVIAAVLMLITATFGFYRGLGYPLAIAVMLMLLAGLTLQPALLAIFGRAAFWPSHKATKRPQVKYGLWGRVAGRLVMRPVVTLLIGVAFFGVLAFFAPLNRPSGFASNTSAPVGTNAYYGNRDLATYFPKASFNPTELIFRFSSPIWSHIQTLETLQADISHSSLFTQVDGALNPAGVALPVSDLEHLHATLGSASKLPQVPARHLVAGGLYQLYRATSNYVSPRGHEVLFETTLRAGSPGQNPAINAVPSIRSFTAQVAHQVGATKSGVAGQAPASYDVSSASNHDLVHIVPLVILIIAILLALVLRSVVAPIFLVVSVGLSFFAALGVAVLIFMEIGSHSGLIFILPFMLFLFLLALGEDYNILVMTRIREESHHRTIKEAVVAAIGATGPAVTSAGMVLAGTFLVLGLASAGQAEVEEIGISLALGVLMDTFLVRTLLVPSAVVLLGRWSWWPSKLSDLESEVDPNEFDSSVAADQDDLEPEGQFT